MKLSIMLLIVITAVSLTVPVFSAVYVWEDESGVVNFAEDLGKVPQKFRSSAKILGDDVFEPSPGNNEPAPKTSEPKPNDSGATKQPATPQGEQKKTYGGKDADSWKMDFAKQKAELKNLQDQLDGVNARMSKTDGMSRSEYRMLENSRKLMEEQEAIARKKLENLTSDADRAGLPPDQR